MKQYTLQTKLYILKYSFSYFFLYSNKMLRRDIHPFVIFSYKKLWISIPVISDIEYFVNLPCRFILYSHTNLSYSKISLFALILYHKQRDLSSHLSQYSMSFSYTGSYVFWNISGLHGYGSPSIPLTI